MLTPLKLRTNNNHYEKGTGVEKGTQVYPTTVSLLNRLNYQAHIIREIVEQQNKPFNVAKTLEHIPDLREYQSYDAHVISQRKTFGIFNEQRTGKTPTMCKALCQMNVKKVLIICPASMVLVWQQEFKKWTGMPCLAVVGTSKKKQEAINNWTHGLVISYESLREVTRTKEENGVTVSYSEGMIDYISKMKDIECVVADEAHRISNHRSNQAKALFKLIKIPRRYALTGTPAPNKPEQIYSILHWLYPDIFTGYWNFIDYYFIPELKHIGWGKKPIREVGDFKPGKVQELQEFLAFNSIQRKRKEVMPWLPDKNYHTIYFDLSDTHMKKLQELRKYFEVEDIVAVNTLDALIKERQFCLHPGLLGIKGKSVKLEWIQHYLKDYPDKQVLIFSKFTSWLQLLSKELNAPLIAGEISLKDRKNLCDEFQSGKIKVLLINIDAGKEGLTLDNAETTIFTDRFPPVGALAQAEDRFVATTKNKADKNHDIYFLVSRGTYEEVIEEGIKHNQTETDLINNYINYIKGS